MYDVEKQSNATYIESQSVAVRNQFIRKVFTILVLQLLVTFGLVALAWYMFRLLITFSNVVSFRIWLYENSFFIFMISLIVMIGMMVISMCKPQCMHCSISLIVVFVKYPTNMIVLVIFVIKFGINNG